MPTKLILCLARLDCSIGQDEWLLFCFPLQDAATSLPLSPFPLFPHPHPSLSPLFIKSCSVPSPGSGNSNSSQGSASQRSNLSQIFNPQHYSRKFQGVILIKQVSPSPGQNFILSTDFSAFALKWMSFFFSLNKSFLDFVISRVSLFFVHIYSLFKILSSGLFLLYPVM